MQRVPDRCTTIVSRPTNKFDPQKENGDSDGLRDEPGMSQVGSARVGKLVQLCGLLRCHQLNGTTGLVMRDMGKRFAVRVQGHDELLSVRARNLRWESFGAEAEVEDNLRHVNVRAQLKQGLEQAATYPSGVAATMGCPALAEGWDAMSHADEEEDELGWPVDAGVWHIRRVIPTVDICDARVKDIEMDALDREVSD